MLGARDTEDMAIEVVSLECRQIQTGTQLRTHLQVVTTALSVSCTRHFKLLQRSEKSMAVGARAEARLTLFCVWDGKNLDWYGTFRPSFGRGASPKWNSEIMLVEYARKF